MSSFFSRPWDSQPQEAAPVDWNNPVTRGLAFVHNAGAGPIEQVRGALAADTAVTLEASGRYGIAASTPTTGAVGRVFGAAKPIPSGDGGFTMVVVGRIPAAALRINMLIQGNETGGAYQQYTFAANSTNSGANSNGLLALLVYNSGWKVQVQSTAGQVDGNEHVFAAVRNGTTSVKLFRDGVDCSSTVASNTTGAADIAGVTIGGTLSATLRGGSKTALALIWNRALSDAEIAEISRNPWQIFEPQRIFIPAAAAGGASFNPAWSIGSNVIVGAAGAHA